MIFEKNVLLVGLSSGFIRYIASQLADKLDFYYLDIDNLLEYSLLDRVKMKQVCGAKYLDEQEKRVIKSLNDYEKTVMSIKLETFIANKKSISNKNLTIYIAFEENQIENLNQLLPSEFKTEIVLNDLLFEEHDNFLKKNCDIVVKCDINNIDESLNKIISIIK